MSNWRWASGRSRGTSHFRSQTRCQDSYKCGVVGAEAFVAVLCDGAGSAPKGGEGASVVVRSIYQRARCHFESTQLAPDDETVRCWVDEARDLIGVAAAKRGLRSRDFAATLICVMATAHETVVVHVGDGGAVGKAATGEWHPLTWPAHGEYASTTFFLTDDPQPRMAIERHPESYGTIVAFTDGLERLVLDFGQRKAHAKFFDGVSAPVFASDSRGRDNRLSEQLVRYLDSETVNARTDDDKTLVIAVRR